MRYPMPNHPCDFEIPDAWLSEAGMESFTPRTPAYRSTDDAVLVPLTDVEPPVRAPAYLKDGRGFDRIRLIHILSRIAMGTAIDPVPLLELSPDGFPPPPYRYRVRDGFHRFYASVAAGFKDLPGKIL